VKSAEATGGASNGAGDGDDDEDETSDSEDEDAALVSAAIPGTTAASSPAAAGGAASSGSSSSDDESGKDSDDGDSSDTSDSDAINSPSGLSTQQQKQAGQAAEVAVDPLDPEALFKQVFSKPLSQADRARVKASAKRMSDVHMRPPSESDTAEDEDEDDDEEDVRRVRADDESSIGDYGSGDEGEGGAMSEIEDEEVTPRASMLELPELSEPIASASSAGSQARQRSPSMPAPAPQQDSTPAQASVPATSPPLTPGRRGSTRFSRIEADDDSDAIDDMPGAVALDEARDEEEEAERNAGMEPDDEEEQDGGTSQPLVPTQVAISPRRTRGSQRVKSVPESQATASQASAQAKTPAKRGRGKGVAAASQVEEPTSQASQATLDARPRRATRSVSAALSESEAVYSTPVGRGARRASQASQAQSETPVSKATG
jgi:hypothetical protein